MAVLKMKSLKRICYSYFLVAVLCARRMPVGHELYNLTLFREKQPQGTIDVWWLYDDGGKNSKKRLSVNFTSYLVADTAIKNSLHTVKHPISFTFIYCSRKCVKSS